MPIATALSEKRKFSRFTFHAKMFSVAPMQNVIKNLSLVALIRFSACASNGIKPHFLNVRRRVRRWIISRRIENVAR